MDPQDPFFAAAQRQGIYSGSVEPRYDPMGGLFGNNPLLAMAAQYGVGQVMGQAGYLPGQFLPQQNMFDQLRSQQYQTERLRASQLGFQQDKATYYQMIGGATQMMGGSFGLSAQRNAQTMAGGIASAMPYLAPMFPELIDSMHGAAGSRGILADQVFRRGQHDVDSVTGRVGLTADTAGGRADAMYKQLYGGGQAAIAGMHGIGAGAAGAMYTELQRRGIGGPSIGAFGREDQLKMLGGADRTDEALRNFDSAKAAERIKSLSGAVAAMKDIFGDAGHPNAPMATLLQGLNNLTQGGLASMAPDKIETMVRNMSAASKQAGMTLDQVGGLMSRGGAVANAFGLDQAFAAPATTSALLFGAAYRDVGKGHIAAFGRRDAEYYAEKDQQLRLASAQSGNTNMISAMSRYQKEVGGLTGEAAEYLAQIDAGDPAVKRKTPAELAAMFKAGGASAAAVQSYIAAADQNKAHDFATGMSDRVGRSFQVKEVRDKAGYSFTQAIVAQGIGPEDAGRLGARMGADLFGLDREVSTDNGKTISALVEKYKNDPALAGKTDAQRREIVGSGLGLFSGRAKKDLGMEMQAALDMFDPRTEARRKVRADEAAQEAVMSKAMSGLGRSGPMARMADLLKNPASSLADGIAQLLGGIKVADISGELDKATTAEGLAGLAAPSRLAAMGAGVKGAVAAFGAEKDAGVRGALSEGVSALIGGVGAGEATKKLLAQYRLTEKDLPDILSGKNTKVPADVRAIFRGLAAAGKGGINGAAEEAGVAVGSKVTADEFKTAGDKLAEARRLGLDGRRSDDDDGTARRLTSQGLGESRRLADLVLGDEKTLDAAGPGAFEAAKGARNGGMELEALAKANGMSVEDLLNYRGDDPATNAAAMRARTVRDKVAGGVETIRKGLSRGGKAPGESAANKDAWKKYKDSETLDESKLNERAVREALAMTGGRLKDDEEVRAIAGSLGTGDAGEKARAYLKGSVAAAGRLKAGGQSAAEKAADTRLAGRTADIREAGGTGLDPASTAAALKDTIARAGTAAKAVQGQKTLLEFAPGSVVRIVGNTMDMSGMRASGSIPPVN